MNIKQFYIDTISAIKSMKTWQKVILSLYFILGLPMLPIAIIQLFARRYLFDDKTFLQADRRQALIFMFCSLMIILTVFYGLMWLAAVCTH